MAYSEDPDQTPSSVFSLLVQSYYGIMSFTVSLNTFL